MKIYICFNLSQGAAGGGNQFLRSFKEFCLGKDIYSEEPEKADIILFNSYQYINEAKKIKELHPDKIFIHRIDGPIRLYCSKNDKRDFVTNTSNRILADGTIFQSKWSRERNYQYGFGKTPHETTILNAADSAIFKEKEKEKSTSHDRKIRLIATSWSPNWNKGFQVYRWLDKHLDYAKYEMTFIGNSPIKYKNIKHIEPMEREALAVELGRHDIFITASQKDPCSNSLIEALQSGLPAIALKDGGHPEIIKRGGELFCRQEQIPEIIDKIVSNYESYQESIELPSMVEVGSQYMQFLTEIYELVKSGRYVPKRLTKKNCLELKMVLARWKIFSQFVSMKQKIEKII